MFWPVLLSGFRVHIVRVGSRAPLIVAMLAIACAAQLAGAQSRNDDRSARTARSTRVARSGDNEMRLDTTVAVEHGTIVDLSASDGRITVRGWDRNAVEIHAVSVSGELQFSQTARSLRLEARRSGRSKTLDATITVRITPTIANEFQARCIFGGEDGWPEVPEGVGTFDLPRTTLEALLADAEFNGCSRTGPSEMPLAIGNAYRALAKQLRNTLKEPQ